VNQPKPDNFVSALLAGDFQEGRLLIHEAFHSMGWRLYEAGDRKQAMQCLKRRSVQVVVAKADMPDWSWKRVLRDVRQLPQPPQLVVVSRLADDSLWSEALHWGAYDVLAEPFQRDEVIRVVASARRHFEPMRQAVGAASIAAAS
jgi:CheY-like chemotaxis protein